MGRASKKLIVDSPRSSNIFSTEVDDTPKRTAKRTIKSPNCFQGYSSFAAVGDIAGGSGGVSASQLKENRKKSLSTPSDTSKAAGVTLKIVEPPRQRGPVGGRSSVFFG